MMHTTWLPCAECSEHLFRFWCKRYSSSLSCVFSLDVAVHRATQFCDCATPEKYITATFMQLVHFILAVSLRDPVSLCLESQCCAVYVCTREGTEIYPSTGAGCYSDMCFPGKSMFPQTHIPA